MAQGETSEGADEVVNQAQLGRGIENNDTLGARQVMVVTRKLLALMMAAMLNSAIETIHSVIPPPCPGPTLSPNALSGG